MTFLSFILMIFTMMSSATMPSVTVAPSVEPPASTGEMVVSSPDAPNIRRYETPYCGLADAACQYMAMWLHEGVRAEIQPVLLAASAEPSRIDADWKTFYDQLPPHVQKYVKEPKRIVAKNLIYVSENDLPDSWDIEAVAKAVGPFDDHILPMVYWDAEVGYNMRYDYTNRIRYRFFSRILTNTDQKSHITMQSETAFFAWLLYSYL